jgi:hypothetical protein
LAASLKAIYQISDTSRLADSCKIGSMAKARPRIEIKSASIDMNACIFLKLTTTRDYIDTIVKVRVGKEKEEISVHRALICFWSPRFFKPAFDGKWKESQAGEMDIEDIDPNVFKYFVQWLYTQSLYADDMAKVPLEVDLIIELYSFAQMQEIAHLQNDCIAALDHNVNAKNWTPVEKLGWIWENTLEDCGLQQYMVDRVVWHCQTSVFKDHSSYFTNADCCRAIMTALHSISYDGLEREHDLQKYYTPS